ncbi:suppressor of cytokine signaling 7-like isoform X2 [Trichomycterus rosablanca]|uniref:suppressor of cytokine signaling 7-like isoform X2 n=1 Tax=Trichomycterus rosablanca TaxID=2290929 RepID=UPI002F34F8B8
MTGQDMSPDFVLMSLVSAAEYDQLEPDDDDEDDEEKRNPSEITGNLGLSHAGGTKGEECTSDAQSGQKCQWIPVLRLTKVDAHGDDAHHHHHHHHHHHLRSESVNMDWANLGDKCPFTSGESFKPGTSPGTIKEPIIRDPVLNFGEPPSLDGQVTVCHGPGEDPSETSDALLVLQGLETDQAPQVPAKDADDRKDQSFVRSSASSSPLSGLMRQVHRLTSNPSCDPPDPPVPPDPPGQEGSYLVPTSILTSASPAPLSRPPTPKHVGSPLVLSACSSSTSISSMNEGSKERVRGSRAKSRRGSFKVCLSKLFRTKSSSSSSSVSGGATGGVSSGASCGAAAGGLPADQMTHKRPSLASSTSSGGSLVDVFGSSEPNTPRSQLVRPHSSYSLVPFTDDLGAPQLSRLPSSMQSLQPSHPPIQHSLSLNDTTLRSVTLRPHPLQPDSQPRAPVQRRSLMCPLTNSFATSLRELEKCGWYWGPMNWEDAEMKLKGKADGSFLVRDSSDPRYILSLSFRSQGVTHHTRMEHYRGTFSLWCHPKFEDRCHSVVEFIERAIMHSKNGRFLYFLRSRVPGLPPTPVQLLYPVSRFSNVKSLQHLCRFCIRQLVRIDHIQELPLPTPLIGYLRKFYFYDPEEEGKLSITVSGRDSGAQEAESHT